MDRKTKILIATILGSGMVVLDGFVVNLALPSIAVNLHADFSDLQWVIDGFLLSLSALILVGGSLGDIFGRKKIYLTGLIGFTIVSTLCAIAPNTQVLIAARIIQGAFGALLVPAGLAVINTNFPKEERGRAIGRWSAWMAIVVPIGPLAGGYIISVSSWRWIFLINIPLGIVCGYLAATSFQETKNSDSRQLDLRGAAVAVVMLAGITYGLIEGPANKWGLKTLMSLLIGILLLPVFKWFEKRHADPMVRLSLFKSRNFTGSNLMTFVMYGALAGFTFILPIYLQTKMGYSAFVAGLALLPVSVLLLLLSARMGSLSAKFGARYFMTIGPIVAGAAMFLLASYKPGDGFLTFLIPRTALFGVGMALFVAPLTATVMSSVPETSSGIASGINNAVTRIGGLIVIALLGIAGTGDIYRSSVIFCSVLAATAGVISYAFIRKPSRS